MFKLSIFLIFLFCIGLKKWFLTEFSEWLVKLEASLPQDHSAGFSVGAKLTYSDIALWAFLTEFFDDVAGVKHSLLPCNGLNAIVSNVANLESLKKWVAERPVTSF